MVLELTTKHALGAQYLYGQTTGRVEEARQGKMEIELVVPSNEGCIKESISKPVKLLTVGTNTLVQIVDGAQENFTALTGTLFPFVPERGQAML